MEPTPDKYDKELGFVFGLLLVIIWIALLLFIENAFFPRQGLWQNPFTAWLTLGLLPFVMMSGDHLIYRRKLGGIETVRSVIGLKSNLLGFLLWFPVLGIFASWGLRPSLSGQRGGRSSHDPRPVSGMGLERNTEKSSPEHGTGVI